MRHPIGWRDERIKHRGETLVVTACFIFLVAFYSHAGIPASTNVREASASGRGNFNLPESYGVPPGSFPAAVQSLEGKTVLLVGDSMAEGIGPWLQQKVVAAGGKFVNRFNRSSTISWWASGPLRSAIARHKPDVIFIALGSNEILLARPEVEAPSIQQMVAQLGGRNAFWVGPPCWEPDRGLVSVIAANFTPGRFYNSNYLKVPRASDGKHPTPQGYRHWVELVWAWSSTSL